MGILTEPPADDVLSVVEHCYEIWSSRGAWPYTAYVRDWADDRGFDFDAVLATQPMVGMGYRALREIYLPGDVSGETRLAPSMAGLHHVLRPSLGRAFCSAMRHAAAIYIAAPRDPLTVAEVTLSGVDLERHLSEHRVDDESVQRVVEIVHEERLFWTRGGTSTTTREWTMNLGRGVRIFEAVNTTGEYLDRVEEHLASLEPKRTVRLSASTPAPSLGAAIDFLDAAWLLWHRPNKPQRLFRLPTVASTMSLANEVSTQAEFDVALSALGDVLKSMVVPSRDPIEPHQTVRLLEAHLIERLPDVASRITEATAALAAAARIRTGAQHAGAAGGRARGFAELGIEYPPTSWAETWSAVRRRVADALDTLRELIYADALSRLDTSSTSG